MKLFEEVLDEIERSNFKIPISLYFKLKKKVKDDHFANCTLDSYLFTFIHNIHVDEYEFKFFKEECYKLYNEN